MTAGTDIDRIQQRITIDAPIERVWDLISEPGWYINDQRIVDHRIERDGDLVTIHDPTHGRFAMRVVELDEPRYAAFRWYTDADDTAGAATLVEFRVEATDSGVVLTVEESGFASLTEPEADRRSRFDDHTTGWRLELSLARAHVTGVSDRG